MAQSEYEERIEELEQRLEALADAVDRADSGGGDDRLHIGGYGELHLNDLENDGDAEDLEQIDFHRFVLEFGYDFSDRVRFFSEVELEHALVEDTNDGSGPGELELEQAYVEFDVTDNHRVKGGVFLIPVGILNETHEPPTFFGVERNQVESEIIPTTWWAAGGLASGTIGDTALSYDVGVHEGFEGKDADIRGARQKSAKATASDFAYTGRLKYTGIRGLELAATVNHQSDLSQGDAGPGDAEEATLLETHAVWQRGPFELRALYAEWDVDGNGLDSAQEDQDGGYIEASYKFLDGRLGVFGRQSNVNFWDGSREVDRDRTSLGINYWPLPDVVVKADVQQDDADNDDDAFDGINLGIGYQF